MSYIGMYYPPLEAVGSNIFGPIPGVLKLCSSDPNPNPNLTNEFTFGHRSKSIRIELLQCDGIFQLEFKVIESNTFGLQLSPGLCKFFKPELDRI